MTLGRTWIVTYCTAVVMKSTKLIQSASFMKHLSRGPMERVIWWWAHETASSFHWDWISSFIDKQSQIYETWMFWTVMTFPSPDWPQRRIDIVSWFSNCLLLLAIWVRGRDSELGGRIMGKSHPPTNFFCPHLNLTIRDFTVRLISVFLLMTSLIMVYNRGCLGHGSLQLSKARNK